MNDDHVLMTYESISRVTRQMLACARDGQWDALVALERDCSALFGRLPATDDAQPRSADYQGRKGRLIRGILDDDAAIRLLVAPWLVQLSTLIGDTARQRRLVKAYEAGG
jgi:flagellar protein FliT